MGSVKVWMRLAALAALQLGSLGMTRMAGAEGWADKISLYGDIRYRVESIQNQGSKVWEDQDRQRVRLRFGFIALPDDYWKVNVRLATGGTDPVSTNQTLGDSFSRKSIAVDIASLEYKVLFNNLTLIGGKMVNPFICVGKSQLIWDGDLTPEGIAGNGKLDLWENTSLVLNGGGFWIAENSSTVDPMLYGGQLGFKTELEDIKFLIGGSYFEYTPSLNQSTFIAGSGKGNSTVLAGSNTVFANAFRLTEGFAEIDVPAYYLLNLAPVKLYGQVAKNFGTNVDKDNAAFTTGLMINKTKAACDWDLGYYYRWLEKDAVVGGFSDSDFLGGGTNGFGHVVQADYMVTDDVKASVTYFGNQKDIKKQTYYQRLQVDLALTF